MASPKAAKVLPVAAPEFNKATEDGVVFRIYRIGSLEVRTIQEPGSSEPLGRDNWR